MPRKPPRQLTSEDRAVWEHVTRQVTPLAAPGSRRADLLGSTNPPPQQEPPQRLNDRPRPGLSEFRIGSGAPEEGVRHDLAPDPGERLARAPQNLDRRTSARLKRGKIAPDARIDLHGMTQAQAHPALSRFILQAQADGHRLVLVITGKGKDRDAGGPIPERRGVLRHQVPHWLHSGVLRQAVLQISEAHFRHGGGGAFYVYLRRRK